MLVNNILPVLLQLMTAQQTPTPEGQAVPPGGKPPSGNTMETPSLSTGHPGVEGAKPMPNAVPVEKPSGISPNTVNSTRQVAGMAEVNERTAIVRENQPPPSSTADNPQFLPLPLKTPLFPESRFYISSREQQKAKQTGGGYESTDLFVELETSNMGRLWFGIISRDNKLGIRCLAENNKVVKELSKEMQALEKTLYRLGFDDVSLNCHPAPPHFRGTPRDPMDIPVQNPIFDLKV